MKKNTTFEIILTVILGILCIYTAYKAYTIKGKVEYITTTDTVYITDSICDTIIAPKYDTTYFNHYDTIPYEVVVNDTLKDTLYIPIALNTYKWDTSIVDTNYETNLKLTATGYDVTLDTVILNTNIHYKQPVQIKEKWYEYIAPAIGVGFGTGGLGIFLGVGYKIF